MTSLTSFQKITGVLTCSFLLCLGLSNVPKADAIVATNDMNAAQSEREGGQDGLKGDQDLLKGGHTTGPERYGGQSGLRSDQDMLKGSHITKSDKEDGQAGPMGVQDKSKGVKSSHMIKGEVLSVEGDTYYLQGQDGKAVRLHTDQTTRMTGNIYQGARVEAEVNDRGHALSIRSTDSTDRRNEADRPS
ncbi:MAG TPA: hypothetical protein VJU54_04445 [Nitrospiraceae bacterium]|nr:hypothetical protein [Nitrospiraceae bacterium]